MSLAHGISGPLALLSLAALDGTVVGGQYEAIKRICSWLDAWRQRSGHGTWWPEVVTRDEIVAGRPSQPRPRRPSWCYGTPGLVH